MPCQIKRFWISALLWLKLFGHRTFTVNCRTQMAFQTPFLFDGHKKLNCRLICCLSCSWSKINTFEIIKIRKPPSSYNLWVIDLDSWAIIYDSWQFLLNSGLWLMRRQMLEFSTACLPDSMVDFRIFFCIIISSSKCAF